MTIILPGLAMSLKSTKYTAEPVHELLDDIPAPIIATYLSVDVPPASEVRPNVSEGSLTILGVDQVSPNLL